MCCINSGYESGQILVCHGQKINVTGDVMLPVEIYLWGVSLCDFGPCF